MEVVCLWIRLLRRNIISQLKDKEVLSGFREEKRAVAQWNITKHEKAKFTKHLHELCSLNDEGEYTLPHEFSQSLIEADEECVVQIGNYIAERNNPFDTSSVTKLTNLVTGKEIDEKTSSFLLACVKTGEDSYNRFREARFIDKKRNYLIPSQRFVKCEKILLQLKRLMLKEETISAIRKILTIPEKETMAYTIFFAMS